MDDSNQANLDQVSQEQLSQGGGPLDPEAVHRIQREVKKRYGLQLTDLFAAELTYDWYEKIDKEFEQFMVREERHIRQIYDRQIQYNASPVSGSTGAKLTQPRIAEFNELYSKTGGST